MARADTEESKTEYNITVEDTKGKIENAFIEIKDGKITVTLPDDKALTTSNQTTVTVTDKENKAVKGVSVTIKGQNNRKDSNYRCKRQGCTAREIVGRWIFLRWRRQSW